MASDPGSSKKQKSPDNITESRRIGIPFRRLRLPRSRVALIIGLVLLIVLVSSGVFYFKSFNFIHKISLLNANITNSYSSSTGTLALNDPLNDNSLGYFWGEGGDSNGNCEFVGGGYHAIVSASGTYQFCAASAVNFSNFAYEMQLTIIQGDYAGIVFRLDNTNHTFYFFRIGIDGSYAFDNFKGDNYGTLKSGTNSGINAGLNQSNVIAVVANGSQIDLYVNHQKIDSVTDATYSQGEVGVAVSDSANPTEAVFTNAKVWTF